jgi:hypothetical protein
MTDDGREDEGRGLRDDGRGEMDEGRRTREDGRGMEVGDLRSEVEGQQLQIKSAKDLKVYQKAYAFCRPSSKRSDRPSPIGPQ